MPLSRYLLIPQLMWYGARSPRDQGLAWDRFWSSIRRTGPDGDVLWDAASADELDRVRARALAHMVTALPVVDVGCGNGRFSRLLAGSFPWVLGIDISAHAVSRAEDESDGVDNVTYRVLDASAAGAGKQLFDEFGEANVFMRGVLHVFDAEQRERAAANLRDLVGQRGGTLGDARERPDDDARRAAYRKGRIREDPRLLRYLAAQSLSLSAGMPADLGTCEA